MSSITSDGQPSSTRNECASEYRKENTLGCDITGSKKPAAKKAPAKKTKAEPKPKKKK